MTGGRAVVADDDPDVRLLIEVAVRRAGCSIVASHADGSSALADALALDPDVLVLDDAMPGMTGAEVVRAVRAARDDDRPFAVLISAGVDALAGRAQEASADAWVAKPFSVRELADVVAERRRS
ncbi:hypothetical protein GCM10009846_16090 [Agrococcus versicolor]|uniref:Response regulatory domain-containing protein n=1 Tax=Agrococcus versicolor TaxID=501482 RepID=A0ABP5MK75_9MICO